MPENNKTVETTFQPKVGDPVKVTLPDGKVVAGILYEVPQADKYGYDTYRVEVIKVVTDKLRTLQLDQLSPATLEDVQQAGIQALAGATTALTPEAIIAREAAETEAKYNKKSLAQAQAEDEDEEDE